MKLFREGHIHFLVFILVFGATSAAALDAPQTLHHSKSRYLSHFSSTHRATTSKTATYSSGSRATASRTSLLKAGTPNTAAYRSGYRSTRRYAGHVTAARTTTSAKLRSATYHRVHHYYERFTA